MVRAVLPHRVEVRRARTARGRVDRDRVLSLYEYELQGGERYRNAELAVVRGGRIVEVQVFFGGRIG